MSQQNGNVIDSLLDTIRRWTLTYRNTVGDGTSIADIAKVTTVEPFTLMSNRLKSTKEIEDIQFGTLTMYNAIYLQAVTVLGTKFVDARVLKTLDSVNPNRDLDTLLMSSVPATESFAGYDYNKTRNEYRHSFIAPCSEAERAKNFRRYHALEGLEYGVNSTYGKSLSNPKPALENYFEEMQYEAEGGVKVERLEAFEKTEGAVGRILNLSFQVGNNRERVNIPVVTRLDAHYVPGKVVTNLMLWNTDSVSLGSRASDVVHGRIHWFYDFLLTRDMLAKQRKLLLDDNTGSVGKLLKQKNKNRAYGALARNISLNSISAIMLISEEDVMDIKRQLGGDLENQSTRKIVFSNSDVMLIGVVDREVEAVTYYVRGIATSTTIPFSRFKGLNAATANSTDALLEVYKSMSSGRVPSF